MHRLTQRAVAILVRVVGGGRDNNRGWADSRRRGGALTELAEAQHPVVGSVRHKQVVAEVSDALASAAGGLGGVTAGEVAQLRAKLSHPEHQVRSLATGERRTEP